MTKPNELNRDTAKRHTKTLLDANDAYFYGYHWDVDDQKELDEAIEFYKIAHKELAKKVKKEKNA